MTPFIQRALINSLRKVSADLFFEVLNNELAKSYSIRLFTLTEIDHQGDKLNGFYSSAPKQYPIGGYKQIETQ